MSLSPRRRKALGQHFLVDEKLADRIVAAAEIAPGERILEIGPGRGVLTERLVPLGKLVAVEKDRWLAAVLRPRFGDELELITGDALEVELPPSDVVVANLPYNIATPLLLGWLRRITDFDGLTLMFQKEVAGRLVAQPGGKAYGRLSVITQWLAEVRHEFNVSKQGFTPPPKVASSVVSVIPRPAPLAPADWQALETVTAAAFGQRRKMLRSSLKPLSLDLGALGIEPTVRAEDLSVEEFCAIARAVHEGAG